MTKDQIITELETRISIEKADQSYWSKRRNFSPDWTQCDIAQNRKEAYGEALQLVKQMEAK